MRTGSYGGWRRRSDLDRAPRRAYRLTGLHYQPRRAPMAGDHYLIVSSDCHAGLPSAEYRGYLDPQYRAAFDESERRAATARAAMGGGMGIMDPEFTQRWEEENAEGLRGGWDA